MGCDVHMYMEVRDKEQCWHEVSRQTVVHDPLGDSQRIVNEYWYPGRNYDEFAILADVRNGYGFAGVDTGDGYVPLAKPKGLPDDVSLSIRERSDSWDIDGHSHSFLTLKELIADEDYWSQTTKKRGIVTNKQAEEFYGQGKLPDSWSGGMSPWPNDTHQQIEWQVTYRDQAYMIHHHLIPAMHDMISYYGAGRIMNDYKNDYRMGAEDVRLVFWFDN